MDRNEAKATIPHQLILQDRLQAELTGVSDVDSFDETTVIAYTPIGELTIRGNALHIKRLDLECGILTVEGHIEALQYADTHKHSGFFGRLFR